MKRASANTSLSYLWVGFGLRTIKPSPWVITGTEAGAEWPPTADCEESLHSWVAGVGARPIGSQHQRSIRASKAIVLVWKIDMKWKPNWKGSLSISFFHCLFALSFKLLPSCGRSRLLSLEAVLMPLASDHTELYNGVDYYGLVHISLTRDRACQAGSPEPFSHCWSLLVFDGKPC